MHCPVESLDTTGIIQNMLFATTVSPRYERIGRGFRGFQKTCWYYNIHPIREGSDWIPPCMIKTQGEQRTQLRQQCITLLYICGKYINVLQPSPWAASMHPYAPVHTHHFALSSMSIYFRIVGYGAFPFANMRRLRNMQDITRPATSVQKWIPFIIKQAQELHKFLQASALLDTITLGWTEFISLGPDKPGESAIKIQHDAILHPTLPGDMYSCRDEFVTIMARSPYHATMRKELTKPPAIAINASTCCRPVSKPGKSTR